MDTIRLTITPQIREVLDTLKRRYPPLSEPEILKVALSEFYAQHTTFSESEKVDMERLMKDGRKTFARWLKKRGKDIDKLTEDEAYEIIKNA
ncbi:hypothetical protein HYW54_04880 [Candidatus Gottesmanbacteria bacterium]|nr:hypothetical protein [Candidatus Gottesmanbacteria bacterium]